MIKIMMLSAAWIAVKPTNIQGILVAEAAILPLDSIHIEKKIAWSKSRKAVIRLNTAFIFRNII